MKNSKFGFTLAEVLITLGIIGVVAALTIPTLITNYKKKQYYTQFMKARSALENAIKLYEDEHGILWDNDADEYLTGEKVKALAAYFPGAQLVTLDNYEDLLQGYNKLKIAFNYDGSNREEEDFDADSVGNAGAFEGNEQGFITNDGMLFMLDVDQGMAGGGLVDTNGPNSGPNTLGRDIFVFYLYKWQQKNNLCNSMWGQNSSCVPLDDYLLTGHSVGSILCHCEGKSPKQSGFCRFLKLGSRLIINVRNVQFWYQKCPQKDFKKS